MYIIFLCIYFYFLQQNNPLTVSSCKRICSCSYRVQKDRRDPVLWYVRLYQTLLKKEENSFPKSLTSQNISFPKAMWSGQENQGQLP